VTRNTTRNISMTLGTALGFLAVAAGGPLYAQTAAPQTYSYTEDPGFPIMGPQVITLIRDGSKEVIDQVMPPMEGRPKEYRGHLVYDFAAHTIYTQVLSDPGSPCSLMTYTSPAAPAEFDIISGAADLIKELTSGDKTPLKQVGAETVNGIPAKILFSDGAAKGKLWVADNGGFPVKVAMIGPDGKEETLIEMKHLSLAKPPASAFTPPSGCTKIAGESSATGAHVGATDTTPKFKVTAATLQPISNYNSACPATIKMTGTITTDGPGTVWYWFAVGSSEPGEALKFEAAGTKTVSHTMTFMPKYGNMGGSALLEAAMEDDQGNHTTVGTGSNNSDFSIDCAK
jgi:hypothetical protein